MALVINDRVKVTSTTTGTGAFALGAAATAVLEATPKLVNVLTE